MHSSDAERARDALRHELARHEISLPSLRVEQACTGDNLVHLGGVRPDVVARLTAVLRGCPPSSARRS
ncbi:hypothetical protein [Streptomyces apocyni]|uniref:hypothetical protein n=1 Tax=Streptomyces apocyni TaxID=2654677 RepID=UPI0012EA84B7|nr:hypothetical protein [Streptomyces apocyni]